MGEFQTIGGRAFAGNTPVFRARPGELVQWDVIAMGSETHTFHVHGHRWRAADGTPRDTQTVGPAESFRLRWRESPCSTCFVTPVPGCTTATSRRTWRPGMIGTYQVAGR